MATLLLSRQPLSRTLRQTSSIIRPLYKATMTQSRLQSTLRNYLVSPSELHRALQENAPSKLSTAPKTIPVCGSWFLPNDPSQRTGQAVFKESHIPAARFFDLDKISDTSSPYPHMLPSPEIFQDAMQRLGIRKDDIVVVYDTAELGIFSAPRVAWTFRVFGHPGVHVLNNYKLWVEQGYPTERGEAGKIEQTTYPLPELDQSRVVAFEEMEEIAHDHNKEGHEAFNILDARSEGRWKGTEPEPRPGLPSGHMPGSTSVPVPEMLDPVTKAFKSPEELRKLFETKALDPSAPVIATCGTGVTATVIETALIEAGLVGEGKSRVYDGSWTEWAQRVKPSDNLIVKSEYLGEIFKRRRRSCKVAELPV